MDERDISIPSELADFQNFLRLMLQEGTEKILVQFNEWLKKNRIDLERIYHYHDRKEEFHEWARKKYYYWRFNQDKNQLKSEIDKLLGEG